MLPLRLLDVWPVSSLQVCGSYLLQRGMDSRKILAHLRASTCKVRGDPRAQVGAPEPALGAGETRGLVPTDGCTECGGRASLGLSHHLEQQPHALAPLTQHRGGGLTLGGLHADSRLPQAAEQDSPPQGPWGSRRAPATHQGLDWCLAFLSLETCQLVGPDAGALWAL